MTRLQSGADDRALPRSHFGRYRWWLAVLVILVAGLIPLVSLGGVPGAVLLLAAFLLAGPVAAAFMLGRAGRSRLVLAGVMVGWLPISYLLSQHRPDSVAPPLPDWIVPYTWMGGAVCVGTFLIQRLRHPAPLTIRNLAGFVVLGLALLNSCCAGALFLDDYLPGWPPQALPDSREAPKPPGWREEDWTRWDEGQTGFSIWVRPPTAVPQDAARRQLAEYLRTQQGWHKRCQPVRGILPWGTHCLTITSVPDDPTLLQITVVRDGTVPHPQPS